MFIYICFIYIYIYIYIHYFYVFVGFHVFVFVFSYQTLLNHYILKHHSKTPAYDDYPARHAISICRRPHVASQVASRTVAKRLPEENGGSPRAFRTVTKRVPEEIGGRTQEKRV